MDFFHFPNFSLDECLTSRFSLSRPRVQSPGSTPEASRCPERDLQSYLPILRGSQQLNLLLLSQLDCSWIFRGELVAFGLWGFASLLDALRSRVLLHQLWYRRRCFLLLFGISSLYLKSLN
ncbi:hypothetical protein DsansV1_C20g0163421 [Dioscorea sansibarensis]